MLLRENVPPVLFCCRMKAPALNHRSACPQAQAIDYDGENNCWILPRRAVAKRGSGHHRHHCVAADPPMTPTKRLCSQLIGKGDGVILRIVAIGSSSPGRSLLHGGSSNRKPVSCHKAETKDHSIENRLRCRLRFRYRAPERDDAICREKVYEDHRTSTIINSHFCRSRSGSA